LARIVFCSRNPARPIVLTQPSPRKSSTARVSHIQVGKRSNPSANASRRLASSPRPRTYRFTPVGHRASPAPAQRPAPNPPVLDYSGELILGPAVRIGTRWLPVGTPRATQHRGASPGQDRTAHWSAGVLPLPVPHRGAARRTWFGTGRGSAAGRDPGRRAKQGRRNLFIRFVWVTSSRVPETGEKKTARGPSVRADHSSAQARRVTGQWTPGRGAPAQHHDPGGPFRLRKRLDRGPACSKR